MLEVRVHFLLLRVTYLSKLCSSSSSSSISIQQQVSDTAQLGQVNQSSAIPGSRALTSMPVERCTSVQVRASTRALQLLLKRSHKHQSGTMILQDTVARIGVEGVGWCILLWLPWLAPLALMLLFYRKDIFLTISIQTPAAGWPPVQTGVLQTQSKPAADWQQLCRRSLIHHSLHIQTLFTH